MMEFTLSRVAMSICGLILLVAVVAPVVHVFEESSEQDVQNIADDTAALIDRFERSKADKMILSVSDVLPGPSYSLILSDGVLTVENDGRMYRSPLSSYVHGGTFVCGDMIEITKNSDGLHAVKL